MCSLQKRWWLQRTVLFGVHEALQTKRSKIMVALVGIQSQKFSFPLCEFPGGCGLRCSAPSVKPSWIQAECSSPWRGKTRRRRSVGFPWAAHSLPLPTAHLTTREACTRSLAGQPYARLLWKNRQPNWRTPSRLCHGGGAKRKWKSTWGHSSQLFMSVSLLFARHGSKCWGGAVNKT